MKRDNTLIAVLALLLIIAVIYIGYTKIQEREDLIFQSGAEYGYETTVKTVFDKAIECQTVPVYVGNQTLNLIAVECPQIQSLLMQNNRSK